VRFQAFHVEGFGHHHDLVVDDLPRLAIFTGANESGKTTLLEFLRFLLFGDRPGTAGAAVYPPLAGGRRGGRLTLEVGGESFQLERFGAGRAAAPLLTDSAGVAVENAEAVLASFLGGLDRSAYERIFAIGAAELEGLGLLDDRALVRQLAAATAGTPALPGALARLDREIGGLLKGERARAPKVNAALLALDDALARQRALAGEGERFARARALLDDRRAGAEERAAELERDRRDLETASRAQPLFERMAQLSARLAEPSLAARPAPRGSLVGLLVAGVAAAAVLVLAGRPGFALGALAVGCGSAALRLAFHRQAARHLQQTRDPLESELGTARSELAAAARTTDPAAYADGLARRRAHLRELEERERALQREIGSLEREVDTLGRGSELEAALADAAAARTELDRGLEEWARFMLCRELLERARARHEAERRPRVLASAERFLEVMLGIEPGSLRLVGEGSLALRDSRGALRAEDQWSSGLADQVYLAVRLAFAQELAGPRGEGPPLVLDDVHLRFDPARRRGLARALAAFARQGQVLVFSSQPELAADLAAEGGGLGGVGFFTVHPGRIDRQF
jgi:uncharacterized protein YhaN